MFSAGESGQVREPVLAQDAAATAFQGFCRNALYECITQVPL